MNGFERTWMLKHLFKGLDREITKPKKVKKLIKTMQKSLRKAIQTYEEMIKGMICSHFAL